MELADLLAPATPATTAAREVLRRFSSPALVNHCERAYLWSASLGELQGIAYDRELLHVAAMLHDLGLVPAFDNHLAAFEDAGGDVGWVFGAGAGWPVARRDRVKEIIVRHMWSEVDPALDAEGHLLCEGTGLDISGRNADVWPADLRAEVLARYPRLTLVPEFTAAFADQARRKPGCAAAAAVASGLAEGPGFRVESPCQPAFLQGFPRRFRRLSIVSGSFLVFSTSVAGGFLACPEPCFAST